MATAAEELEILTTDNIVNRLKIAKEGGIAQINANIWHGTDHTGTPRKYSVLGTA